MKPSYQLLSEFRKQLEKKEGILTSSKGETLLLGIAFDGRLLCTLIYSFIEIYAPDTTYVNFVGDRSMVSLKFYILVQLYKVSYPEPHQISAESLNMGVGLYPQMIEKVGQRHS